MSNVKDQVENYLKTDRTLTGGRNLYNKIPGKNLALLKSFSRMTNTPKNVEKLCYELCKIAGIPERIRAILMQKPVTKAEETVKEPTPEPEVLTPADLLLKFNPETSDYHESLALAKELNIKGKIKKKVDLFAALEKARNKEMELQLAELPDDQKASIKLREQFPFLSEPGCPDSLKILVNDLITSREKFIESQPKLHEAMSASESKVLVDFVLENYINNKEAWAELEHYKETGEVLGKHPVFERLANKESITLMSTTDLTKKINTLNTNIIRNKQKGNTDLVARDEELLEHAKMVLSKR